MISALGQSRPSPKGRDLHPGASHIIDAMKAAQVSRLIWISSHGVGDSRGRSGFLFERIFVPLRLRAEFADKERQEALVTASDLDWTIVRPARLTNGPLTPGGCGPNHACGSASGTQSAGPTWPSSCSTNWNTATTCSAPQP